MDRSVQFREDDKPRREDREMRRDDRDIRRDDRELRRDDRDIRRDDRELRRDDREMRRDDREIRRAAPPGASRDGESNWRAARAPVDRTAERPSERGGDREQMHRQRPDREEFGGRSARPVPEREERDRPPIRLSEKPKSEFIL